MMHKVVLYLDVDGVLNSFGRSPWPDSEKVSVFSTSHKRWYTFHVSKKMGEAILQLDTEIRWLSTWHADCNTQVAPVVFGYETDFPVYGKETFSRYDKHSAILNHLDTTPEVPFIWVDDDSIDLSLFEGVPTMDRYLLCSPDPRVGLDFHHIEQFQEFIKKDFT